LDLTDSQGQIRAQQWDRESYAGSAIDMPIRKRVENVDSQGKKALPLKAGDCMLGDLTDLGRVTTNVLGKRLRDLYIDRLGLLPKQLEMKDENKIYLRSTNMGRTIESLHSLVSGLLPETKTKADDSTARRASAFVPTMLVRNGIVENLLPNTFGCSRLRDLDRKFTVFAAKLHNPKLAELDDLLKPHMDGNAPRVDGRPQLNGILDTIRAAKAHGLAIPAVFEDPKVIDVVESAVCSEWYSAYQAEDLETRQQFRRLAMARFLHELTDRLTDKAQRPSQTPLQMAIYAAHDTSLAGVLNTLDVFDNRWPAFTSAIGFELFKDRKTGILTKLGLRSSPTYVRMRYGDKELRLPACQAKGDHLDGHQEFCTLQAFTRAVNQLNHPQGLTWEQECDQGR
jgi:acid phosphatase